MTTTPFRQTIRQGQSGRDVHAVKIAMCQMHVPGSGSMITHGTLARFAGHSFIECVRTVQRAHHLHVDGVYGKATHAIIAPHFTAYERWMYRAAAIRQPPPPPVPSTAQAAAQQLIEQHNAGKYRDDRGGSELAQIKATAAGKAVWSPLGHYVHLDGRVLEALVWLIQDAGFKQIGTFALCTDHGVDTPKGHAGGYAVDISSIDGVAVTAPVSASKPKTLALLKALHRAPANLAPWQLISGGCANVIQSECEALCIPSAAFYGSEALREHCNHVHLGYEPR